MADGKARHDCTIAASQMALTANCNRDPKRKPTPFCPDDFLPPTYRSRREEKIYDTKAGFAAMKRLFCKKGK
jgi:hypothetical protein